MIYCIMGYSGTGKSTIARMASKRSGVDLIVSYTSRPVRPNEKDGVDYHFVDFDHFEANKDDFIEIREYTVFDGSVWKYGYKKSSFSDKNKDYVVVIETDGYEAFKQYFGKDQVMIVFIDSKEEDILARLSKRGDNPEEIKRRISDDKEKFKEIQENKNIKHVYNYYDLNFAVVQVSKTIKKGEK